MTLSVHTFLATVDLVTSRCEPMRPEAGAILGRSVKDGRARSSLRSIVIEPIGSHRMLPIRIGRPLISFPPIPCFSSRSSRFQRCCRRRRSSLLCVATPQLSGRKLFLVLPGLVDPQPRRPNSHPDSHSDPSRRTEVMTGEVSLSFTPPEGRDMPGMVCAAARARSRTAVRIRTGRGVRIRMPQDDDFTVVGSPVLWSCI